MAEEAVDFYKNGPSLMQRYLPFWMINYAKRLAAIVVAIVAIIIPLFTYMPRLYAWFLNLRLARPGTSVPSFHIASIRGWSFGGTRSTSLVQS